MGVVSCATTMLDQGVFQNIGAVTWDTTAKTVGFTAVSGNGYFVNTTSGAITVTLPSSPAAGAIVGIKDYANTADTNAITIGRNGSNIQGTAADYLINTEGRSVLLVYVDATKGWLVTSASQASDIITPEFITATGGTITTSGDYKIHTFTGPGTFCVSAVGNPLGSDSVDYLVIAGGGGGAGGGAGAGGYRESSGAASGCYTTSPLGSCVSALSVSVTGYPVTVGAGGTGRPNACSPCQSTSAKLGSNSSFSSITSTGGGGGLQWGSACGSGSLGDSNTQGGSGGGGGQRGATARHGAGNTPPVSPPQGNDGGCNQASGGESGGSGGGGGATAAGSNGTTGQGGPGGAGATSSINATPTIRAGGGGGGGRAAPGSTAGTGGPGGGGAGSPNSTGTAGTANTGGGGGGGGFSGSYQTGGNGGSGVVIIRYKFQ